MNTQTVLGLDVGDARIGLARGNTIVRLPSPLETVSNDKDIVGKMQEIVKRENVDLLVVGIPRNLNGEETAQSQSIRDFANELSSSVGLTVQFVDETLSSKRAQEYLTDKKIQNVSEDSIAACFILEEYFGNMESV
jgi:putative Holliday junction resolvase